MSIKEIAADENPNPTSFNVVSKALLLIVKNEAPILHLKAAQFDLVKQQSEEHPSTTDKIKAVRLQDKLSLQMNPAWSFFIFLAVPWAMWDLSSPTRDRMCVPCIGSAVLTTGPPGKSSGLMFLKNQSFQEKFQLCKPRYFCILETS